MGRGKIALSLALLGLLIILALMASNAAAERWTGYGLMHTDQWVVTVGGSPGAGTGTAEGPAGGMEGRIYGVRLDYTAGVSNTTDVTLTVGSPAQTVMIKSNSATDAWYYPGIQLTGPTGTVISGAYEAIPGMGTMIAAAGQSSTGTITVTVLWGQQ